MGMIDGGVGKAGFRDLPRLAWLIAGASTDGPTARPVQRRISFIAGLLAVAAGPAFLWTDASGRMVLGVQSKEESTAQMVRGLAVSGLGTLICLAVPVLGFILMMQHFPAYAGLVLLAVLGVLIFLLAMLGPLGRDEFAAMRALKPWEGSPAGFRYVTVLAADPSVTPQELERFVNQVLVGLLPSGTCLGIIATAAGQLGFFQRMGFSRIGTSLALLGHVPADAANAPDLL